MSFDFPLFGYPCPSFPNALSFPSSPSPNDVTRLVSYLLPAALNHHQFYRVSFLVSHTSFISWGTSLPLLALICMIFLPRVFDFIILDDDCNQFLYYFSTAFSLILGEIIRLSKQTIAPFSDLLEGSISDWQTTKR